MDQQQQDEGNDKSSSWSSSSRRKYKLGDVKLYMDLRADRYLRLFRKGRICRLGGQSLKPEWIEVLSSSYLDSDEEDEREVIKNLKIEENSSVCNLIYELSNKDLVSYI